MATTRALFYVGDVLERIGSDGKAEGRIIRLNAAYDPNPESPNYTYWKASPTGQIEMTVNNPAGYEVFVRGKQYWIDFTPVEE